MAKKKRYSRVEIARTQGELQNETADRTRVEGDKIAELELENLRLRRQVTDLLLDKIKLEEAEIPAPCSLKFGRKAYRVKRAHPPG